MHLTLLVAEGPLAGAKIVLAAGQVALVGRAERSDFVLAHDRYLSARHMLVECTSTGCRVRDLNSTNGTWLNGGRIADSELLDGDVILIGRTPLRVAIQSDQDRGGGPPQPGVMRTVQSTSGPAVPLAAQDTRFSPWNRVSKEELERLGADESTEQFPREAVLPPRPADSPSPAPPHESADSVSGH